MIKHCVFLRLCDSKGVTSDSLQIVPSFRVDFRALCISLRYSPFCRAVARVEQMRVQIESEESDRRRGRSTMQKELDALRQRNSALDEQLKSAQQAAMTQSTRVST